MFARLAVAGTVVALCLSAGRVRSEEIFVTAPNNEILAVDFDTGATRTVVRDKGTLFRGLAAFTDGNALRLVAANHTQGGDIRIYDPSSGKRATLVKLSGARGVAVSPEGEIFAVNRDRGRDDIVLFIPRRGGCPTSLSGPFPPGCGPGGYEEAMPIDASVFVRGKKTKELADVRLLRAGVSGLARSGQLLVLVRDPAMLIAYTSPGRWSDCAGGCTPEKIASLKGYTPTGLDVTGDAVLVTTEQGAVLEVTASGVGPLVYLGGKGEKISVGALGGLQVAYATVSNKGGKVYRFFTDGSDLRSIRAHVPEGVSTPSSRVVALGDGNDVELLLPTLRTTFDRVSSKGLIDANCDLYPMPAGGRPYPLTLGDLGILQDAGVVIPPYVEPFRIGDPVSGPLAFFLCHVETTAGLRETIEMHEDEFRFLGYDPDCDTDNSPDGVKQQARFFWAPSAGEENFEGEAFIDISAGCGSNVGRGMKFSWLMPAAQDERAICEILDFKLGGLEGTLGDFADAIDGACIGDAGDPGPVPPGTFTHVGGSKSDWVYAPEAEGVFGDGGNGFFEGGGTATFVFKNAAWSHRLGLVDAASAESALFDDGTTPAGASFELSVSEPYTFFVANTSGSPGRASSDGATAGSASLAVYRNLHDPGLVALFYDDGGGAPDADYDDLIVTVRGEPGTLCSLRAVVADARESLGDPAACAADPNDSDLPGLLEALDALGAIVEDGADDIDDIDANRSGEIEARTESAIFMACKLTDGQPQCEVHEAPSHAHSH